MLAARGLLESKTNSQIE